MSLQNADKNAMFKEAWYGTDMQYEIESEITPQIQVLVKVDDSRKDEQIFFAILPICCMCVCVCMLWKKENKLAYTL